MPLIKDIEQRRQAFRKRTKRVQANFQKGDARFTIDLPDMEGFGDLPLEFINKQTLLRVHRRIGNEFRKGDSEWPEETQFSRKHFRGDVEGIYNPAYYARFVEARKNPRTHPPAPARSYVRERWRPLMEEDINAQVRRQNRGG